jgi:endoglucanase
MAELSQFLTDLFETPSPPGREAQRQEIWLRYLLDVVDEYWTDTYGNAVGVVDPDSTPRIALASHADEIGYTINRIGPSGHLHVAELGRPVNEGAVGARVTIHTGEGPVPGVVGTAHGDVAQADHLHIDIGVTSSDEARRRVRVGNPVTFDDRIRRLSGPHVAGRADNAAGMWVCGETLRRVSPREVGVAAVSTVQEELGNKGAEMIRNHLSVDAVVAVDVTFASDNPAGDPSDGIVDLGGGPVVGVGTVNHPNLTSELCQVAEEQSIPYQRQAAGNRSGSHADAFYSAATGLPTVKIGIPCRYNHSPNEVVSTADMEAIVDLLTAWVERTDGSELSVSIDP